MGGAGRDGDDVVPALDVALAVAVVARRSDVAVVGRAGSVVATGTMRLQLPTSQPPGSLRPVDTTVPSAPRPTVFRCPAVDPQLEVGDRESPGHSQGVAAAHLATITQC